MFVNKNYTNYYRVSEHLNILNIYSVPSTYRQLLPERKIITTVLN